MDEVLTPLLTTEWGRRTGIGLFIVMSILTFILFIHTLFTFYDDLRLTRAHIAHQGDTLKANDQLTMMISQLPNKHLFGKYGVVEQSAILPVTSLQIRLIGVIKSTPEKFSRVIISEENQPGKVYSTGDTLPSSGVRIYGITAEGVVLDNSGRLEKLPLQRPPLVFQGMPKPLGE